MEFAFTEEQEMIRDTAASFLAEVSGSEAVRRAMATEQGYESELWSRICGEMYWQAIHIPEEYGGMGLGYVELVAMMEQMGRYLLCSPYFSTVCLAANALLVAGSHEQKTRWLGQLCEGSLTATLAFNGGSSRWDAQAISATWRRENGAYVLNGDYRYVIDGHTSGLLVVAAREEGSSGEEGISLFLLPADTQGVNTQWLPTMDQARKQAGIRLENVHLPEDALMGEAASVAKSYCSDAYFSIAGDSLQLFGGVGFTWEYDVHLYFKRAKSSEHMFGNGAAHRERLAAMLLD